MADEESLFTFSADNETVLTSLEEIDSSLASIDEQINQIIASASELSTLTDAFASIAEVLSEMDTVLSETTAAMEEMSSATATAVTSIDELDTASISISSLGAAADEAAQQLNVLSESEVSAGESAQGFSANAAGGLAVVGMAVAGATASLFQMGQQAQDSFSLIQGMAGVSSKDLDAMMPQLEQDATKLGTSMKSVGDGLYYVESAGYTGSDSLKVLWSSMAAGKAAHVDMQVVANSLSSELHAYSESADQAQHYTDMMIESVVQGKQNFQDFGSAIGPLAAVGHATGVSFAEVAAAEATMTQINPHVKQDAQQLAHLFQAVGLNADQVAASARKMGVDFDESHYQTLNLIDKLKYLQDQTKGNKSEFEKLVGGTSGMQAALDLLSQGGETYAGVLDKIQHSQGATDKAFQASDNTISGHMDHMSASFSVLSKNLVDMISPTIMSGLDWLTHAIGGFTDFLTNHTQQALPILAFLATLIGGTLVGAIGAFIGPMVAAAAPILGVVAAIAALVGGAIWLYTTFPQVRDAVHVVIEKLQEFWEILQSEVWPTMQNVGAFLSGVFLTAWHGISTAIHDLTPGLQHIAQLIGNDLGPVFKSLGGFIQEGFTQFLVIAPKVAEILGGGLMTAAQNIGPILEKIGSFLISTFISAWKGTEDAIHHIWPILQEIGGFLVSTFTPVWQQLQGTVKDLMPIWDQLVHALQQLAPIGKEIWSVVSQLAPIFEFLGAIIGVLLVVNIGILVGMISGLIRGFAALLSGVIQIFQGIIQVVTGVVQVIVGIWGFLVDLVTGHWSRLGADGAQIWSGIVNMFQGVWHIIVGIFTGAFGAIAGFVSGFVSGILGFFHHLADMLVGHSIIPDMINAIFGWFGRMHDLVMGVIYKFVEIVVTWFMNLRTQVDEKVSGLINSIHDFFSQLPGKALTWATDMIDQFVAGIVNGTSKVADAVKNVAGTIASFLHFSKPDIGPLADSDQWMPDFGTMLTEGMNQQIGRVKGATANLALSVQQAAPSARNLAALGNGPGAGNSTMETLLAQMLTQMRSSQNQQQIQPPSATLGAVTQQFGPVNVFGVNDLASFYQQLNALAGLAYENGTRGATNGLGF